MRVSVQQDGCRYRGPGEPFLDVTSLGTAESDIFAARIGSFIGKTTVNIYRKKEEIELQSE